MLRFLPQIFSRILLCVAGIYFTSCNSPGEPGMSEYSIPDPISYNLHIRPILSENCFACHGPDANKREAGLRLDLEEEAYKALPENPSAHPLVPGQPKRSEVYRRISSDEESIIMPPPESNLDLMPHQIELIKKWISQGAEYEPHWAFVPPLKAELPDIKQKAWPRETLDYFILNKQEKAGLSPNPEANKEMLLRRLSFDLQGLPPNIELMDRFLEDDSPEAYEKMVDELLGGEAFGEKMAVHWMDISRYADSHGYQDDYLRTQWPWRDWVIHAFNENMPYDQFITWQMAGDLLPKPSKEQLLATGFNRNHKITEESGAIDEEYRVMYVVDRTNTVGKALLGITMECAQCHDHKFDPISQKEYFKLYSFFNNIAEYGIEESTPGFSKKSPAKLPTLEITDADVKGLLSFINKPDSATQVRAVMGPVEPGKNFQALASEAAKLKVSVMTDLDSLRPSFVLERGDYQMHGEAVSPGTPESILPFSEKYPPNRLGLSQWLFDKNHPLTARVFVNRIWQEIFGKAIVPTPGDFGMQGELPTHPELLDWLAVDFMENDWNIKRLIKMIVMSATYRQSTEVIPEKLEKDPPNIWLARYPRQRLPAELIRDLVLSSSGLLIPTIGGPSVKPYQPYGLWEAATSGRGNLSQYQQDTGASLYRRGLYTFIKRTVPPPSLILFDGSNRDECEVERTLTNTPLQALFMLNDPTVLEASRVLAARLLEDNHSSDNLINSAFRSIISRKPDLEEQTLLQDYYTEQFQLFTQNRSNAEELLQIGEFPLNRKLDIASLAAAMQVIQIIYNLEEAIIKS